MHWIWLFAYQVVLYQQNANLSNFEILIKFEPHAD